MTVVALPTLPTGNATDARRTRCGARGDCMAVVRGQTTLQLDFFCVPDPALIAATVFPTLSTLKKNSQMVKNLSNGQKSRLLVQMVGYEQRLSRTNRERPALTSK